MCPGDVVVVNDAATLPGSLHGVGPAGTPVEARLVEQRGADLWRVALLGPGNWRTPTERRPAPELARSGDTLTFAEELRATVARISRVSSRLLDLRFDRGGAALWEALYKHGRPIQYAHVDGELPLWSVQTAFGARPWAAEMPSAGRPLSWSILLGLRRRGISIASVTHAAGLSATGDPRIDAALPLPERFAVSSRCVSTIEDARTRGGKVVAIGTTVARALESAAASGVLQATSGITDLVIGPHYTPRVVDSVLTGMHAPSESHYQLLRAFAREELLEQSWRHALDAHYECHEFGDIALFAPWTRCASGPMLAA
jgi:S-adenosylmethionine:tRNA ribosyltransferase-isomerase